MSALKHTAHQRQHDAYTHTHTRAHCFPFSNTHTQRHVLREDLSIGSLSIQTPPPPLSHTTPLLPPPAPPPLSLSLPSVHLAFSGCVFYCCVRAKDSKRAACRGRARTHPSLLTNRQSRMQGRLISPEQVGTLGMVVGRGRGDVRDAGGKCRSGQ